MKNFIRLCVTGKRNGAVELSLCGLLARTVAAISNLTRADLPRCNSFQGPYLSGKPVKDRRLASRIHLLTWVVSGKKRSGLVRQSRRDKILLGCCVCESFKNHHRQNWLPGHGPAFSRKFCVAWAFCRNRELFLPIQKHSRNYHKFACSSTLSMRYLGSLSNEIM